MTLQSKLKLVSGVLSTPIITVIMWTLTLFFINGVDRPTFSDDLLDQLWLEMNEETMKTLTYDMEKLDEKSANDPGDIKQSDIIKNDFLCNSKYMSLYVVSLPSEQKKPIKLRCQRIASMYEHILNGGEM